jgi:hypothetical protein
LPDPGTEDHLKGRTRRRTGCWSHVYHPVGYGW